MKTRKLLALLLALALALTLAFTAMAGESGGAEGESAAESAGEEAASDDGAAGVGENVQPAAGSQPDTSMGGNATSRPPDNSTKAIDVLGSRAAIYVEYSDEGYTVSENITDAYTVEKAQAIEAVDPGDTMAISGLYIECDTVDWDEENTVGNSGLIINALTDEETTFELGSAADNYEAPDGEMYDSVIVMNYVEDELLPESATETAAGCGIAFNGNSLLLNNVYVESNYTGRPSIHIPASTRDKNVSQYSDIICVDSTIINHSTRAMLLMGGDVWFLNSKGITDSWGALSYDNTSTTMYVVNSLSENTGSGYSIYDAAGCTAYVYGSRVIGGGTGITVCRTATLTMDSLENADETATAPYNGEADLLVPNATADGRSFLAAYDYPIKIHADMSGADSVATAILKNSYISTLPEDVVMSDGSTYTPAEASESSTGSDAISALVSEYQSGMIVYIACHNGSVVFDNCELVSRKGELVHSMFTYDSMASGIYPVDGAEYVGDTVLITNMSAEGDIIHEDYMRKMEVTIENAELTGKVVGTTLAGWNNYWREQIEALGGDEADEQSVIHDETYETLWGVRMTMGENSTWNVTGTSNLYSLTLADGAVIQPAEGCTMKIYVECAMGNDLEEYDISTGMELDHFEADTPYEGVVIVIE